MAIIVVHKKDSQCLGEINTFHISRSDYVYALVKWLHIWPSKYDHYETTLIPGHQIDNTLKFYKYS